MKIFNRPLKDLKVIQHKRITDSRGSLRETFIKKVMDWENFVFDYATISKKNVLRGFHFQYKYQQSKLVSVIRGKILDCVIDLRKGSKTFGKHYSLILSEKNCKSFYIPKGFAHAYYSYEKINIIYYKLSDYYKPGFEDGIIWNEKQINFTWPCKSPLLSKKDKNLGTFKDFKKEFGSLK